MTAMADMRALLGALRDQVHAVGSEPTDDEWRAMLSTYRMFRAELDEDGLSEFRATLRARTSDPGSLAFLYRFFDWRQERRSKSEPYRQHKRAVAKTWRESNPDRCAEYDRQRAKIPERQEQIKKARKAYKDRQRSGL